MQDEIQAEAAGHAAGLTYENEMPPATTPRERVTKAPLAEIPSWPGTVVRRTACFRTPMSRPSNVQRHGRTCSGHPRLASLASSEGVHVGDRRGHDGGESVRCREVPLNIEHQSLMKPET